MDMLAETKWRSFFFLRAAVFLLAVSAASLAVAFIFGDLTLRGFLRAMELNAYMYGAVCTIYYASFLVARLYPRLSKENVISEDEARHASADRFFRGDQDTQ